MPHGGIALAHNRQHGLAEHSVSLARALSKFLNSKHDWGFHREDGRMRRRLRRNAIRAIIRARIIRVMS